MLELTDQGDQRACVFTGPVFTEDDPKHINRPGEVAVLIPSGFWKILAIRRQAQLRAAGFLVWQRDFDRPTPVSFDPLLEQVRITTIEYLSGLSFGDLRNADPLRFGVQLVQRREYLTPTPGTAETRPAVITSVRDIVI